MERNVQPFKDALLKELSLLEKELSSVGTRNPNNPKDWIAKKGDLDTSSADRNESADQLEQYEENTGILVDLEIRYNNVKRALKKIKEGTYGICEIAKHPIEKDRLKANPAARTCKEHLGEEEFLK